MGRGVVETVKGREIWDGTENVFHDLEGESLERIPRCNIPLGHDQQNVCEASIKRSHDSTKR